MKRFFYFLIVSISIALFGHSFNLDVNAFNVKQDLVEASEDLNEEQLIDEDGTYSKSEELILYLNTYGRLPKNHITKDQAAELGWISGEGNLWEVTDHKIIGGDIFYNREGNLPTVEGRTYYQCDINYKGGYRGAERIVYSNDGLIYYTDDHFETFSIIQ